jgi:hypothetical protein
MEQGLSRGGEETAGSPSTKHFGGVTNMSKESDKKPLWKRPPDWGSDLFDLSKPSLSGMKNPLAWIISIILVGGYFLVFGDPGGPDK